MDLDNAKPQKSKTEPPVAARGETSVDGWRVEAESAAPGTERPGASGLMEAVVERRNLQAALKRVKQNKGSPGIDGMTVDDLPNHLRVHWRSLREQLLTGTYQPQPVQRQMIPKSGGGERELGIPTVLDRFIQQALLQVLQPRFDPTFSEHSHGFRPRRSAHDAVREAKRYVQQGRRWVVDVDLEAFFNRVNHDVLMGRLAKRIEDCRVLGLIRRYLSAGIMANGVVTERYEGTPQGGPLSPLLANVLLDEVDKELEKRGHAFVRYADDSNVYVRSRRAGERVMQALRRLYAKLHLRVNEAKSAVAPVQGRKFLGYTFWLSSKNEVRCTIARKALDAMKDRVRHMTSRMRGRSLAQVCQDLRVYLPGWRAYFRLVESPGGLSRAGLLDPTPPPRTANEAVGAWRDGLPRAAPTRDLSRRRSPRGGQRDPLVADLWDASPQHRAAEQALRRAGASPARRVTSTPRTAGCGPACPVVWQGSPEIIRGPYADTFVERACEETGLSRPTIYNYVDRSRSLVEVLGPALLKEMLSGREKIANDENILIKIAQLPAARAQKVVEVYMHGRGEAAAARLAEKSLHGHRLGKLTNGHEARLRGGVLVDDPNDDRAPNVLNEARNVVLFGDALVHLRESIPPESVQTCITSPPFYGQRDFGTRHWFGGDSSCKHDTRVAHRPFHGGFATSEYRTAKASVDGQTAVTHSCSKCGAWLGQLGQEPDIGMFLDHLVEVFRAVRRVLRPDGVCWIEIGDSYNAGTATASRPTTTAAQGVWTREAARSRTNASNVPVKSLLLVPQRLLDHARAAVYVTHGPVSCAAGRDSGYVAVSRQHRHLLRPLGVGRTGAHLRRLRQADPRARRKKGVLGALPHHRLSPASSRRPPRSSCCRRASPRSGRPRRRGTPPARRAGSPRHCEPRRRGCPVSRRPRISMAPMAVASDGALVVNAAQLATSGSLEAIVEMAKRTGLDVFVGVVVPERLRSRVLRDLDDAAADIVGRLGPKLTGDASSSADAPSSAASRRGDRDQHARPRRHQRGRRRQP
jgi:group II intron reverse transcriptase/maturase